MMVGRPSSKMAIGTNLQISNGTTYLTYVNYPFQCEHLTEAHKKNPALGWLIPGRVLNKIR